MDGTLAVFNPTKTLEELYEKGYFVNLSPIFNVVNAINRIMQSENNIEVYILSAVLSDSKFALQEKNEWLNRYLPDIDAEHRIFPPCGSDKKDFIPNGITSHDILLDDYTVNLTQWEPPGRGLKLLNGINDTRGSWRGERVDGNMHNLADKIVQSFNTKSLEARISEASRQAKGHHGITADHINIER